MDLVRSVPLLLVFAFMFLLYEGYVVEHGFHPTATEPTRRTPVYTDEAGRPYVAVCFFGLTRSLRKYTYDSIKELLLGALQRQNFATHVFLHTYAVEVLFNPWAREYNVTLDKDEWRLLEPLAYEIENLDEVDAFIDYSAYLKYGNPWVRMNPSNITVFNHIRQLRSLKRCWNLVERQMNETGILYRYVMMARPDVRYLPPGLPDLESYCLSRECYEGLEPPRSRIGIAYEDRFAVGSPETIKLWATRLDLGFFFMDQYKSGLFSEIFSRWAVLWYDLQYVVFPFCFERIRADGTKSLVSDVNECGKALNPDTKPPQIIRTVPGSSVAYEAVEEADESFVTRRPPLLPRFQSPWRGAMRIPRRTRFGGFR